MAAARVPDGLPCPVRINRSARARRLTLRLETSGDGAVLTVPARIRQAEIDDFLHRHRGWLAAAIARQPSVVHVRPGARIPVDGMLVTIRQSDTARGPAQLSGSDLWLTGRVAPGRQVAAFLRMRARDTLAPLARGYARQLGRQITRFAVRDTRSRWGSCSSSGALSFSWRLAMTPPAIQDYVAAHEAAHLVALNHSVRYWAVVARLMPDFETHRGWLRQHGRGLHAYRFDAEPAGL